MRKRRFIEYGLAIMIVLIFFPQYLWAKDVSILPELELKTIYDDNLDFEPSDEKDSFGANAIPRLTLRYASELLELYLIGELDVIKYFSETDFDRTNQLYGINGQYRLFPRWKFAGNFSYRRDQTVDSQLQETGQSFESRRVETYDAGAGIT